MVFVSVFVIDDELKLIDCPLLVTVYSYCLLACFARRGFCWCNFLQNGLANGMCTFSALC